jgi:peptide/nickel transport system ATP-binding protein
MTKEADQHILEVSSLSVDFAQTQAVKGISFSVKKGKVIGIVGESGSGKSVTALSIMQLLGKGARLQADAIHYTNRDGQVMNLAELPEQELRRIRGNEIGMIFQEPMTSLNPVYTCGHQVMESLKLHLGMKKAEARARTLELFERVELPRPEKMLKAFPHEISGGQKQRVMIAMAMACKPGILIADEPTTALDVTVQASILGLMKQLQREEDASIIFISHDLGVIAEIADEVLVMYQGNIVESGSILDVFSNPGHPYTKGLLACRPPLDKKLHRLPTISDFLEEKEPVNIHTNGREPLQTTGEVILKVDGLKTWFPLRGDWFQSKKRYVKAVDDVSFEVNRGETLGLVGESGCGKTTLGRSILRLIEPTEGEINFDGVNIRSLGNEALRSIRKDMQIIFQDPYSALNPRIPIGKTIMEPMEVHGLYDNEGSRKARAIELLTKVGLGEEHLMRFPHEFSGGQRQRVCIARVLAVEPRFIICDESVSALDVSIQAQVLNLLKSLQEEFGFTYIFISHDLSVVRFMSDRIMVMHEGKVVEYNHADQLFEKPQSDYTRQLIKSVPKGSLESIRKRIQSVP